MAARWIAFNLSNGLVSVVSNVVLTGALGSVTGWPLLASNLLAVGVASLVNFLISDRLIFSEFARGPSPIDGPVAKRVGIHITAIGTGNPNTM